LSSYTFEYWFRYGAEEQDFDTVTVSAETLDKAIEKVREIRRWIFKITQI
jgi:hypothetical protein